MIPKILAVVFDNEVKPLEAITLTKLLLGKMESDSIVMQLNHVRIIVDKSMSKKDMCIKYARNCFYRNNHARNEINKVNLVEVLQTVDEVQEWDNLLDDIFGSPYKEPGGDDV